MESQRGLTLIELLIALAVAAVVFGLAVPALGGALEAGRASAVRGDLLDSLAQAGMRAGITGMHVVLCPTIDGEHCSDDADWSAGWLVFQDVNGSRELEGGERLLRRHGPLPGHVHLRSTSGRVRIVFQGNGGNAGSNVTFTLCDGRGPRQARTLVMSNTGGLRDGVATQAALGAACAP
jgi:type IV fimbrial biogenesis protein FimT